MEDCVGGRVRSSGKTPPTSMRKASMRQTDRRTQTQTLMLPTSVNRSMACHPASNRPSPGRCLPLPSSLASRFAKADSASARPCRFARRPPRTRIHHGNTPQLDDSQQWTGRVAGWAVGWLPRDVRACVGRQTFAPSTTPQTPHRHAHGAHGPSVPRLPAKTLPAHKLTARTLTQGR